MVGRDPDERHRISSPLELLFDLTFATSFSVAAHQLAELLGAGHPAAGLIGFGVASFGICWAWTNFTWFASAFDTDDWLFRLVTMVQMGGVLLLAIGMPRMFASVEQGRHLDGGVMVAGYVVMRIAMVFQWLRAAHGDPNRRPAALTYAGFVTAAQVGWVVLIGANLPLAPTLALLCLLAGVEFAAPVVAERLSATPWHAHHIAERHNLFAIIALGEGIAGTVAALSATIARQGWTPDAILVGSAGLGLTFGIWWAYHTLPSAEVLHAKRGRAFGWAYLQLATIISIVAAGAGLQVAAQGIERGASGDAQRTILALGVPVGLFIVLIYGLYIFLVRRIDPLRLGLLVLTAGIMAAALEMRGVPLAWRLLIVALSPVPTIVGYEVSGYRRQAKAIAALPGS